MSKNFVLIASYPKSGNTWTRIVFAKLRWGLDYSINNLDGTFHGMMLRFLFDEIVPVNSADLEEREIECFFPDVIRQANAESTERVFVKVHDAARRTQQGDWFYPPECVHATIYLTRHPFDVAVSTAHHLGISPEKAVDTLADKFALRRARSGLVEALPQYFGTWSENAASWLGDCPYPVTFARYEDVLADPVPQFLRLASAAGFAVDAQEISLVVEASRFERLQKVEREQGFIERPKTSSRFFRAGRPRSWEGLLDEALRERLVRDHGAMMARLGYTADGGVTDMAFPQGFSLP